MKANYCLPDLIDFLKHMPTPNDKTYSYLDIMGMTYNENVISNLYAFFFNPKEDHKLELTFLNALDSSLGLNLNITDFEVYREYHTSQGGRIDIVLKENTSEDISTVVVIENKIYHTVENDLDSYLLSFSENKTIGVLLTLSGIEVHKNFHTISHRDLLHSVKKQLVDKLDVMPSKYLILLQDFIFHINNMDNKVEDSLYEFMFDEGINIQKVLAVQDNVFEDIVSQIKKAAELVGWSHNRTSGWYQSIKSHDKVYTLYFGLQSIFASRKFYVELYIYSNTAVKKEEKIEFNNSSQNFAQTHNIILEKAYDGNKQFKAASKIYSINSVENLKSFDELSYSILKKEWMPLIDTFTKSISL